MNSSPAVANGVVYVVSNDGKLYALDAAGVSGCSGTPKTCGPLFSATTGPPTSTFNSSSLAVAYGKVFIGSADDKLHAFELP
ncbi:MAG: PQQ-binding-like beta-propeller repeat protein [Acidimicrobiia bacterium]